MDVRDMLRQMNVKDNYNDAQTTQKNRRYMHGMMYLLLFLFCLGFYIVNMIINGQYPFGSHSFLYQDAYDQYTGMLQTFLEWLHSGDKSTFLWDHGLGMDMLLNMFYYCMSPFNIIAVICGSGHVELAMVIMIVVKASLLAPSGLYFFRRTELKRYADEETGRGWQTAVEIVLSLSYALCGFVLVYEHNVIWLDGLILVPFLAIAVERMAAGKGKIAYTVLLAVGFIVNFYFAFYLCLFIVLYFLLQDWKTLREFGRGILRFLIWSVIAGMIAGVVLVPAFYAVLHLSGAGSMDDKLPWYQLGNIGNFINSFYPLNKVTTGNLFNHNNYCGTLIVLLVILLFFMKKIEWTWKLRYLTVLIFLAFAMNQAGLNYVLHGFAVTHGMGNRFAFIWTFLLLGAAYVCLLNIKKIRMWQAGAAFGSCLVLFLLELFFNRDETNPNSYVAVLIFIVAYFGLFVFVLRKSIKWKTFYIWVVSLWIIELVLNGSYVLSAKGNNRSLTDDIKQTSRETAYAECDLEAGERKTALYSYDNLQLSNTNCYSSMANGSAIDSFASLGLSHYQNIEYTYRRTTPVTALMYNVRYIMTNELGAAGGYHMVAAPDGTYGYLYEADALAGMGFLLDEDILNWSGEKSAAENQNELVMLGMDQPELEDLFEKKTLTDDMISFTGLNAAKQGDGVYAYTAQADIATSMIVSYKAEQAEDLYVECSDTRLQGVDVYVNDQQVVSSVYPESAGMIHIGNVNAGDEVKLRFATAAVRNESGIKTVALYAINEETVQAFKEYVLKNTMEFDGYDGNCLNGHITADKAGILYLAVPYNEGFTAAVDGKKVAPVKIGTGLMGVPVEVGEHVITLTYHTPYLMAGICLSVIGILILAGYLIIRRKKSSDK
jgi:uncharacterized membrane protein YfhO